jgi:hypothetical protein
MNFLLSDGQAASIGALILVLVLIYILTHFDDSEF